MRKSFGRELVRRSAIASAIATALVLVGVMAPAAQARTESFQALAPSPVPLTSVTTDPATGLIYAQENQGKKFFVYDPRTNVWTELAPAPLDSGNNGGATFLDGKVYTAYTGNESQLGVYDVAAGTWTTIANPVEEGTGNITTDNGMIYLAVDRKFVEYSPTTGVTTPLAEPPAMEESCNDGFEEYGGLQVIGAEIYGHQGDGCRGFAVYDIASNSWTELPLTPLAEGENTEGPVLGSAFNPLTDSYLAYGPYGGKVLYRWDAAAAAWSTSTLPFTINDTGSAYVGIPGYEGVYIAQGQTGTEFTRLTERTEADLGIGMTAQAASSTGGDVTYSIGVKNGGPETAAGIVVSDPLPAGTKVVSAPGCTGTTVLSCSLGALPSGASVALTVKLAAGFGTVTNTVKVSSYALDPNPANDGASVTVNLPKPATPPAANPKCVIPSVRGLTLAKAKAALVAGGCKAGKLFRHRGNKIAKGSVIKGGNAPGKNIAPGSKVNLIVSKGKKVHKHAQK